MVSTLFVVADQSRAQLYRVKGSRVAPTLEEVDLLDHEVEASANKSGSHHSLSFFDSKGPVDEEQRRFVRRLVERLRQGQQSGEFRRLYIAAPANFVGKIRGLYGSALASTVEREIIGDYTGQDRNKLEARMARWLS